MTRRWVILSALWLCVLGGTAALFVLRNPLHDTLTLKLDHLGTMTDATLQAEAIQFQNAHSQSAISATSVLISPTFTGRDNQQNLWFLAAQTAGRTGEMGADQIFLQQVSGTVVQPSSPPNQPSAIYHLTADSGLFTEADSALTVTGNVVLQGAGLSIFSPQVTAQLDAQTVAASAPVTLVGTFGRWHAHLTGQTLTADANSGRIRVSGRIHGTLNHLTTEGNTP